MITPTSPTYQPIEQTFGEKLLQLTNLLRQPMIDFACSRLVKLLLLQPSNLYLYKEYIYIQGEGGRTNGLSTKKGWLVGELGFLGSPGSQGKAIERERGNV